MIVKIGDYELDIKATQTVEGEKLPYSEDEAAGHFLNRVSCSLSDVAQAVQLSHDIFSGLKEAGFYDRIRI